MRSLFRSAPSNINQPPPVITQMEVCGHLEIEDNKVAIDMHGFLIDPQDWNQAIALKQAELCEIEMTDEHWLVINYIREKYQQSLFVPDVKNLLTHMQEQLGERQATQKYLYTLFPYGYAIYACRIAGMKIPLKTRLDS